MKSERARFITALFPSVGMVLAAVLSFTNVFGALESMGIIVLSLMIIFPVLFFSQGLACFFGKGNFGVSLMISLGTFGVILIRFMNATALIYVLVYIIAAFLGYAAPRIMAKKPSHLS